MSVLGVSVMRILFSSFILVLSWLGVSGQVCDLQLEVREPLSELTISMVAATMIKVDSLRVFRAESDGEGHFRELPEGEYFVTLSKPGYRSLAEVVSHSCESAKKGTVIGFFSLVPAGKKENFNNEPRPLGLRTDRLTKLGPSNSATGAVNSITAVPKTVSGGVLNGKATSLPKPLYPEAAMAVRAAGAVSVQVLVGEEGDVISAHAVSGHPLLREAAESAARSARFSPTRLSGQPVKVVGVIVYNFVP